jgi:LysR family transcriptional regulator, transcriptional activator for aaeXAB operon
MDRIFYELSVLCRAVAHRNLSGASLHVGLSQPQLSRIVRKIEETLSVVLLDRAAKRNAAWTPAAFRLAEFYTKKLRSFDRDLQALMEDSQPSQVVVGCLEGLIQLALPFVHHLLEKGGVRLVEIDVFDLDRLESRFSRGELDLIFTSRRPGRRKFTFVRELGYQSLDAVNTNPKFRVMSTFEFGSKRGASLGPERTLISNSLAIRKEWFQRFGGKGSLPSEPRRKQSSKLDTEQILLLGTDTISPMVWRQVLECCGFRA